MTGALILLTSFVIVAGSLGRNHNGIESEVTSPYRFRDWTVSISSSVNSHQNIVDDSDDARTNLSFDVGVSRMLGYKTAFEIVGSVDIAEESGDPFSLFVMSSRFKTYPSLLRSQRDHVYLLVGPNIVKSSPSGSDARIGFGFDVGMGVDVFVSASSTVFLEGSVRLLSMKSDVGVSYSPPLVLPARVLNVDNSPFAGMASLKLGTRFGL